MTTVHTRLSRDQGSVSVFAAVLVPVLLLSIALIVDGADRARAIEHADAIAAEAARTAATAVDTRGQAVIVDRAAGSAAAQGYLAATGHTGNVTWTPDGRVRVTVAHTEPAVIGLLGPTWQVTGTATAGLGVGTTTGESP
jgi:hypothetical protein